MRRIRVVAVLFGVCCLALPGLGQADRQVQVQSAITVLNLDETVPAESVQDIRLEWVAPAYPKQAGSVSFLQCLATGRNRGRLVRGMELELQGGIIAEDGTTLQRLGRKVRPFKPTARFSWSYPDFSADHSEVSIFFEGGAFGQELLDWIGLMCGVIQRTRCENDLLTACLLGNRRFMLQLDFGSDHGRVVDRNARSSAFSSPDSNAAIVFVEMADRCQANNHFWVSLGSLTRTPFRLVIEDTLSGETNSFPNPRFGQVNLYDAAFGCP